MKFNSKYLIAIIAVLIIITGFVFYSISGENFLGMVRYSESVVSPSSVVSKTFKTNELTTISENSFTNKLISQNFQNVEFKTSWAPSRYQEESGKALIKLYPFPKVKYSEQIKDAIFSSFKNWRHVGVKGVGVISSVDFSHQNIKHLLMGTEAAGIYRSTDFGQNWTKLDNFPTNLVERVAIDPQNENHYFAIANWLYLYESFDKGNSWQLNTIIDSLRTGPQDIQWNGDKIFIRAGKNAKISQNNGKNWSSHVLPFGNDGYVKIKNNGFGAAVAPINTDSFADFNFYVTDNYGITWTQKLTSTQNEKISAFDISTNGLNIVVARFNDVADEVSFAKSNDGGNSWNYVTPPNQGYTTYWPQDLLLDDNNPDHFYMFVYMKMGSLFTSYDGGQTLLSGAYTINEYDAIALRITNTEESSLITPMDLRFNHMIKLVEEIPLEKINITDQTKTSLVNEDIFKETIQIQPVETVKESSIELESVKYELPKLTKTYLLLPTDQGLFLYDESKKKMSNIVKDLYLGDTGEITLTSCPRLYAGLWHVGYFFIDSDGFTWTYTNSEKGGATGGEDNGCNTPIMYSQGMYLSDGINADMDVSYWIWNSLQIGQIGSTLFHYHDQWWYVKIGQKLYRLNIPNRQVEEIQLPAFDTLHAFTIEKSNPDNYWILTQTGISINLWKSQDLQNWTLIKELDNFQYILYRETLQVNNEIENRNGIFRSGSMDIDGSTILLGDGFGVAVSNDFGNTWHQNFLYAYSSNIIKDDKGRLFVGLLTYRTTAPFLTGKNNSGIWYSVDHGETWQLLESETAKSQIESLALDKNKNILYAGTQNESLLQFNLSNYNLPEPIKIFTKTIEVDPNIIDFGRN